MDWRRRTFRYARTLTGLTLSNSPLAKKQPHSRCIVLTPDSSTALSNTLGLGADRAIEFTVVIPDGRLVTANKFTNPDLFFALRGGGGGTFGVVMTLATLVAPQIKLQIVFCKYASTDMKDTAGLLKILIANAQKWVRFFPFAPPLCSHSFRVPFVLQN